MKEEKKIPIEVNQKQYNLIQLMEKKLRFGTIEVRVHDGKPQDVLIKEMKISLKDLDNNLGFK